MKSYCVTIEFEIRAESRQIALRRWTSLVDGLRPTAWEEGTLYSQICEGRGDNCPIRETSK